MAISGGSFGESSLNVCAISRRILVYIVLQDFQQTETNALHHVIDKLGLAYTLRPSFQWRMGIVGIASEFIVLQIGVVQYSKIV